MPLRHQPSREQLVDQSVLRTKEYVRGQSSANSGTAEADDEAAVAAVIWRRVGGTKGRKVVFLIISKYRKCGFMISV